jgi:hypothetical protein
MNEEEAKAAIAEIQRQLDFYKRQTDWDEDLKVITINPTDAKALIELWNFYQMYKPR